MYDYYGKNSSFPNITELKQQMGAIRDLIAYRIVISMPVCHLKDGEKREEIELKYPHEIANAIPGFPGRERLYSRDLWKTGGKNLPR